MPHLAGRDGCGEVRGPEPDEAAEDVAEGEEEHLPPAGGGGGEGEAPAGVGGDGDGGEDVEGVVAGEGEDVAACEASRLTWSEYQGPAQLSHRPQGSAWGSSSCSISICMRHRELFW